VSGEEVRVAAKEKERVCFIQSNILSLKRTKTRKRRGKEKKGEEGIGGGMESGNLHVRLGGD
jgi:hypothetical protein